jgi:FKBP-type peptidyl-prolyl cis-trans isomerase SlyD
VHIADRKVASFHYTLTNDSGDVLDSSVGREPLSYLHGARNLVPGLEKALAGRGVGDRFTVDVAPQEGYGLRDKDLVHVVPRDAFGGAAVEPGMQFIARTPMGETPVVVVRVDGDRVTIDANHRLAGETLHFAVEITDVREASGEELLHGHVHGEHAT